MKQFSLHRELSASQKRKGEITFLAQVPFVTFALVGMITIALLKSFFSQPFLAAAVAVSLILIYCGLVSGVRKLRLREDQLGDNCYYLGFLYTLASLSMALYQFTMASAGAGSSAISDIVANFGIALSSTIVGILLRVTINQGRKDVPELERDARMMLTESMVSLRVQLNDAVLGLKSFCDQTKQITSDAIRENALKANTALDESVAKIAETSAAVLGRIEEAFGEFNENTKKLNLVAAGTVKALEALIDRLESMEPPSDLISKRLEAIMGSSEKAGEVLRHRLEADEKAIAGAADRIREIEERLKAAAEMAGSAGNGLSGVGSAARRAVEAAESAAEKLTALTGTMGKSFEAQERLVGEVRLGSERLAGGLMEEQKRLASQARASLDELFGALRGHNEAMAAELDRARRMTADTGSAMADMAEVLTRRVDGLRAAEVAEGARV